MSKERHHQGSGDKNRHDQIKYSDSVPWERFSAGMIDDSPCKLNAISTVPGSGSNNTRAAYSGIIRTSSASSSSKSSGWRSCNVASTEPRLPAALDAVELRTTRGGVRDRDGGLTEKSVGGRGLQRLPSGQPASLAIARRTRAGDGPCGAKRGGLHRLQLPLQSRFTHQILVAGNRSTAIDLTPQLEQLGQ